MCRSSSRLSHPLTFLLEVVWRLNWIQNEELGFSFSSPHPGCWTCWLVFSICWHSKEVFSKASEGMDLMQSGKEQQLPSSMSFYMLPVEGVTLFRVCLPTPRSGLKVCVCLQVLRTGLDVCVFLLPKPVFEVDLSTSTISCALHSKILINTMSS